MLPKLDIPSDIVVVTGHYGSGKTNLSINLALDFRRQGREVVLADLDIVNPYFRSADFGELAAGQGIGLVTPSYANSNIDIPSLTNALDAKLGSGAMVIVDVGGDDAGAYALGRYAARIKEHPYTMLYVVNCYRYLTREPAEAASLMAEIESASRLRVTQLVNNSNLAGETTPEDITASLDYAQEAARLCGRELAFTAARRDLCDELTGVEALYPLDIHVRVPWSSGPI